MEEGPPEREKTRKAMLPRASSLVDMQVVAQ
jgi:hypothetical protein